MAFPSFWNSNDQLQFFLENEMFFSSVEGIQDKTPETFASCFMKRCES